MKISVFPRRASKKAAFLLALLLLCAAAFPGLNAAAADRVLKDTDTPVSHSVVSNGRYSNWAGVSSVSQFTDEQGNFCFAVDEGDRVSVYKTVNGETALQCAISNPYDSFGGAVCDSSGNLYMVWGRNNGTGDTSLPTVFVGKYTAAGAPVASVGGNGSEGMDWYYDAGFYTQSPFSGGNCDIAVNGNLLVVNYARGMYSGHQSNTLLAVDLTSMTVKTGMVTYNSHSFDQRVTPYGETGFLLESQGDCYPRAFATTLVDGTRTVNELETFSFWVEEGTFDDYDMYRLNRTRARLGNILETDRGAALVASSVRSLSEAAQTEPYDVFVQVFDPAGPLRGAASFVTSGTRSGTAGNNGDQAVTDYGVSWLTDLAGTGKTAEAVQAISTGQDTVVVLYELYENGRFDSTWYMLLNGDGSVRKDAASLGSVRLNIDEDPVYAQGAVRWVSNPSGSQKLVLHSLYLDSSGDESGDDPNPSPDIPFTDVPGGAYYRDAVAWAYDNSVTTGKTQNLFDPEGVCTRAEVVTFLWRAMGMPYPESPDNPFTDVSLTDYYYYPVLWAVERGITVGTSEDTFSPELTCSTAHILTFLYRAFDIGSDGWYAGAAHWAREENLLENTGVAVSPEENCSRANVVTFLYRMLA